MTKGWHNEPGRHSLAARGCHTGRKRSKGRYNVDLRVRGKKPQGLSDISPEDLRKLENLPDDELLEVLIKIGKRGGLFKGIRADGNPHLKRGAGRNGIAYEVDPEGDSIRIMEITEIEGATGDKYWTPMQIGYTTAWATDEEKAYVITQTLEFNLLDFLKMTIRNDHGFVDYSHNSNNLMELMLAYFGYWGGDEALYHSREEAWRDFSGQW